MKNLKKLLAMSIVLAMVLSTFAAVTTVSAFDDVKPDNAALYEAVTILQATGIVNGKTATEFGPTDTILRSEAAAILVRMLGLESAAEGAKNTASAFTDVPTNHWANGYINVAASRSIINGNGDGTFTPDEKVTYEQMIKMIVVACGYTPWAEGKGGYPTGYLVIGSEIGLTKGMKSINGPSPATRGDIALLAYKGMDTPILEQTGWGNNLDYIQRDGKGSGNTYKTLFSKYLGIYKFKALVVGNDRSNLDSTTKVAKGSIQYQIMDNFGLDDNDYRNDDRKLAKVGKTNAADFLGSRAVVFIGQDDVYSEDYVVAIVSDGTRTKSFEIPASNFEPINTNLTGSNPVLQYWEDPDTQKKPTEIKISAKATLMINGKYCYSIASNGAAIKNELSDLKNGKIKFVNNNTNEDEEYDFIYVTTYKQGVINEIDLDSQTVSFVNSEIDTLSFNKDDFPNVDFTYTLKDTAGNAVDFKSLKKYDVLAVAFSDNESMDSSDYMDVIVISNSVTGTVEESDATSGKYKINGSEYKVSKSGTITLKLEDEGVFYLDIDGKIIYKSTVTTLYNYAYLLNAGSTSGLDTDSQVKVFYNDGSVKTYYLSSTNVKVQFGEDSSITLTSTEKIKEFGDYIAAYCNSKTTTATLQGLNFYSTQSTSVKNAMNKLHFLRKIQDTETVISRVVSLSFNSDGKISKVVFPKVNFNDTNTDVKVTRDEQNFTLSAVGTGFRYRANSQSFDGKYYLTSKTKVMYIPTESAVSNETDGSSLELRSMSSFTDDKEYKIALFDLDTNSNVGLVVLADDKGFPAYDQHMAMVNRFGTKIVNGQETEIIHMVYNNAAVVYPLSPDGYKVYNLGTADPVVNGNIDTIDLAVGDVIHFTLNGAGNINNIAKVFDMASKTMRGFNTAGVNDDVKYVFGRTYAVGSTFKVTAGAMTEDDAVFFTRASGSSIAYAEYDQVNTSRTDQAVVINSSGFKKYQDKPDNYYYIIARMYDGQAYDVFQYRFAADVSDSKLNVANA